jgi:hypothetical protein
VCSDLERDCQCDTWGMVTRIVTWLLAEMLDVSIASSSIQVSVAVLTEEEGRNKILCTSINRSTTSQMRERYILYALIMAVLQHSYSLSLTYRPCLAESA